MSRNNASNSQPVADPQQLAHRAVQADPQLRAIRDAFTEDLKAAGVRQIGPKGSSELLYRIGQLLARRARRS